MQKFVKKLNSKSKGQAMLIVLVITTLTMLLLLSMADRLSVARSTLRRSSEFDKSIVDSENKVNDVINALNSDDTSVRDCLETAGNNNTYVEIPEACGVSATDARIFVRKSLDPALVVEKTNVLILSVNDNPAVQVPTTAVNAECRNEDGDISPSINRFLISRIYISATGEFKADKAIFSCTGAAAITNGTQTGNVSLVSGSTSANGTLRGNTLLITARLLDGSNDTGRIALYAVGDPDGNNAYDNFMSTSKNDFLLYGLGGLGSDSMVSFERPRGSTALGNSSLDYAYLGEDTP